MDLEKHNPLEPIEVSPGLKAAKGRAAEIVQQASFDNAMRVIDDLITKVSAMPIAERYKDRKSNPGEFAQPSGLMMISGGSEKELARNLLLRRLNALKGRIATLSCQMRDLIIEIEATQTDD